MARMWRQGADVQRSGTLCDVMGRACVVRAWIGGARATHVWGTCVGGGRTDGAHEEVGVARAVHVCEKTHVRGVCDFARAFGTGRRAEGGRGVWRTSRGRSVGVRGTCVSDKARRRDVRHTCVLEKVCAAHVRDTCGARAGGQKIRRRGRARTCGNACVVRVEGVRFRVRAHVSGSAKDVRFHEHTC